MAEMLEFKLTDGGSVAVWSSDVVLIHSVVFTPDGGTDKMPCTRVHYKYGNEVQWFSTFTPITEIANRISEAEF